MSLFRDGDVAIVEQAKPELLKGLRVNFDYFDTLCRKDAAWSYVPGRR
jgi:hypothetical protein